MIMRLLDVLVALCLMLPVLATAQTPPAAPKRATASELEGAWAGQSMEVSGVEQPAETAALMHWTFKGDRLIMRGNSRTDPSRESDLAYKIDSTTSPKQLEFTDPNGTLVPGIYELKGDVLTVCMRRGAGDRPTSFKTDASERLIKIVLKRAPK